MLRVQAERFPLIVVIVNTSAVIGESVAVF